jgi:tRNA-specific 2-thiouridylase
VAATLRLAEGRALVDLAGEETGVAPGQACVLYDGDDADARILGGGVIDAALGGAERAEAA